MPPALRIAREELGHFSVPVPVCLMGEEQHLLGLGSVLVSTTARAHTYAEETPTPEFQIRIDGVPGDSSEHSRRLKDRWRELLGRFVLHDEEELEGLKITFEPGDVGTALEAPRVLASPSFAVSLVCAALAHRSSSGELAPQDIAREACGLLGELDAPGHRGAARFYPRALMCLRGGARYVECGGGTINVQQLIPPESLVLVTAPSSEISERGPISEQRVARALEKMGAEAGSIVAENDEGLTEFFQLARDHLEDEETMAVYGLLRVHQLILSFLEKLSNRVVDHDVLGEICDEESDILERSFGFDCPPLREIRQAASEAGALGAKGISDPAGRHGLLVVAPDRRDSVAQVVASRFPDATVLPVDVDATGLRAEAPEPEGTGAGRE